METSVVYSPKTKTFNDKVCEGYKMNAGIQQTLIAVPWTVLHKWCTAD